MMHGHIYKSLKNARLNVNKKASTWVPANIPKLLQQGECTRNNQG